HLLALQISNAADAFVRKQRIASDMHSGEHRRRRTGVDRRNHVRRIDHREIKRAAFHGLGRSAAVGCYRYVLNVGEAFGSQQFVGDVGRRVANESAGRDANRGGFRRRLLGKGRAAAEETCRTGQRRGGQKVATIVEPLHDGFLYKAQSVDCARVSRLRSSHTLAAASNANFGSERTLATLWFQCPLFEAEIRKRSCRSISGGQPDLAETTPDFASLIRATG